MATTPEDNNDNDDEDDGGEDDDVDATAVAVPAAPVYADDDDDDTDSAADCIEGDDAKEEKVDRPPATIAPVPNRATGGTVLVGTSPHLFRLLLDTFPTPVAEPVDTDSPESTAADAGVVAGGETCSNCIETGAAVETTEEGV